MVAGVLLQAGEPGLVDSAGIELDTTLGSWDFLWNMPVAALSDAADPVGPCGGAAAYRLPLFQQLGGFDEALFAYWEDVELALRLRETGSRCALAADARAVHEHGQTVGAGSPAARRLEAFGRGYVLAKYRVGGRSPTRRAAIAALDWPVLAVHLLARREAGPLRERLRGRAVGLRSRAHRPPLELATVGFATALRRQAEQLRLRSPAACRRTSRTMGESRQLVREELRAPAPREGREPPRERPQGAEVGPVHGPAGRLEQRDEVAPREPAQVRDVSVLGRRVAERAAHDEVAQERPVARVRNGDMHPRARRGDPVQPPQQLPRVDEVLEHVVEEDRVERLADGVELRSAGPVRTSS